MECLPKDMIESIPVDITNLEIGDSLTVSDIIVTSKIKILSDENLQVISINAPKVIDSSDEETEEADEVSTEPEVITEKNEEE